jgi:hypothetical protein
MEYPMDMRPDPDADPIHEPASTDDAVRVLPPAERIGAGAALDESPDAEGLDASLLDAMERELGGDLTFEADAAPVPERAETTEPADAAAATATADAPAFDLHPPSDLPETPAMAFADDDPLTAEDDPALETAPVESMLEASALEEPAADRTREAEPAPNAEGEAAAPVDAADLTQAAHAGMPLEAVEFELALNAQDIVAKGFEAAVRRAAEMADGHFLFHMPAHAVPDCQRVAAVSLASPDAPFTLLVLLGADGRSVRLEDAQASDNPLAGMAVSYGGLLAHLKSLPASAAA